MARITAGLPAASERRRGVSSHRRRERPRHSTRAGRKLQHAQPQMARLGKDALLDVMRYMRTHCRALHLNVRPFSDEALADALVHVRPFVGRLWRLDADLPAAVAHLRRTRRLQRDARRTAFVNHRAR